MKFKPNHLKCSFLSLTLSIVGLTTFAQNADLKEKTIMLSNNTKVLYHFKENNVKEGSYYIRNVANDQLILKGAYTDNIRSGNWYFYDDAGKLETVYSYQLNKLAFIDSVLLNKITINIPDQTAEVTEKTQIPVLLSPIKMFMAMMAENIIIPAEHFSINESLPIQIITKISELGKPRYYVSYKYKGKRLEEQIRPKSSAFEIEWIPANYEKKPIKSEFIINTEIANSAKAEDLHMRFKWNY